MERRDFFKRLGLAGAAVAVAPQILAEIQSPPEAIAGADLVIKTPDGRTIPLKECNIDMNIIERHSGGGLYLGDTCVFQIYEWSLSIERPLIDVSRDPRFSTKENPVSPWKEYERGPSSARLSGSGVLREDFSPFDTTEPLRLVLVDNDSVFDAEGYITSLSTTASLGDPINSEMEFQIAGEILRTIK